jgi:type IV pilus assembly protein PilM
MSHGPASARASWLASPPPAVAVEITATRVTGVALASQGPAPVVAAHATEPLPSGIAVPALNAPNVLDERGLAGVLRSVLGQLGQRVRKVALVLPDSVAKVSLVRFDKVPARVQDLEQLIRWQVRKAAPFRIEDAQVAWQPGVALPGGGREYLVTVARRDIVHDYERACEAAGAHAGIVDLASLNQINAVLAGPGEDADWLLVHVADDYATLAVVRGDDLIFFRNRAAGSEGELTDLVHQTAMYHEDRLGGGGFARIVLAGASVLGAEEAERLRLVLEERIGVRVDPIDIAHAATLRDRIAAPQELRDALAAPLGILVRERGSRRAGARAARPEVA